MYAFRTNLTLFLLSDPIGLGLYSQDRKALKLARRAEREYLETKGVYNKSLIDRVKEFLK